MLSALNKEEGARVPSTTVLSHKPSGQLLAPSSLRFFLMLDYARGLRHLRKGFSSCIKATTRLLIHRLIRLHSSALSAGARRDFIIRGGHWYTYKTGQVDQQIIVFSSQEKQNKTEKNLLALI